MRKDFGSIYNFSSNQKKKETKNEFIKQKVKEETGSGEEQSNSTTSKLNNCFDDKLSSTHSFRTDPQQDCQCWLWKFPTPSLSPTLNGKGFKTGGKDYMVRKASTESFFPFVHIFLSAFWLPKHPQSMTLMLPLRFLQFIFETI